MGNRQLRLIVEPVPSFEGVRTVVAKIDYDDELECFYTVIENGAIRYSEKALPANFHTHEAMDVNPDDLGSLLAFMNEWGLVTAPDREPFRPKRVGTVGQIIATPTKDGVEKDTEAAAALLDKLDARHPGLKRGYFSLLARVDVLPIYPFAPRYEVEGSVRWLQQTVNKLTKAASTGYDDTPDWVGIEEINLRGDIDRIERVVSPYFPLFAAAFDEVKKEAEKKRGEKKKVQPPVAPLTIAALVQLIDYLTTGEAYRVCNECGKLFLYKRHEGGNEGIVSRSTSIYCSEGCNKAHKSTALAAARKKARHEAKAARLAQEGR